MVCLDHPDLRSIIDCSIEVDAYFLIKRRDLYHYFISFLSKQNFSENIIEKGRKKK